MSTVLLLGRIAVTVEDARRAIDLPDVRILTGTSLADVDDAFSHEPHIDHVILGAGIDLEDRLQIVRRIFGHSDSTTIHLKDRSSGPAGFLPFAHAVLSGLIAG